MLDAETAEWAKLEPQHSLITTADFLQDQGHSIEDVGDSLMTLALHIAHRLRGPRIVAAKLLILADRFAAEADRLEGITGAGTDSPVN